MKDSHEIFRNVKSMDCNLSIAVEACRPSPEVKKEIEIFKDNLSNQTVYHIIMSVLCLKVLTLLKVEVSTSGYFKFSIFNALR